MRKSLGCHVSALLVLAASAAAQAPERLVHTGSRAQGTVTVTRVLPDPTYLMHFSGDEQIEYQINPRDLWVKHGAIRVYEKYSDAWPIDRGGVGWRDATGTAYGTPFLEGYCILTAQSSTSNSVTFDYTDSYEGIHHRRHTYTLEGKSLRIRVQDLDQNHAWRSNYCGLLLGATRDTESPKYLPMQGALGTPIAMYRNGTAHYFLGNMLDLYSSNAANWVLDQQGHLSPTATSFRFNVSTFPYYNQTSTGEVCAPLDDTVNITVSSKVGDVFVTPTQGPSPYRELLEGRTMALFAGPAWAPYNQLWDKFAQWGIDEIAGYYFTGWTSRAIDPPLNQNAGPDWYPAVDPANFTSMVAAGKAKGSLLAAYMAFNELPPGASPSVYDPTHIAKTNLGAYKVGAQTGFPSIAATASAVHAVRESSLARANYGLNMAYLDIQTYASPSGGADGDHIDQMQNSGWARTLSAAIRDQKAWMKRISDIYEGPLVGEGSISTRAASNEWLWAGYCDSVQRVINADTGVQASNAPLGSTFAPTTWPVIPEYEQRVFSRLQCNHGNGFGDRFFSRNDGPACVNMTTGATVYPLTETALDRYRVYEITYGKSAYIMTNGPYDGPTGNYMHYADIIREHYLMNALQTLYFEGATRSILYMHNGVLKTFEAILFETEDTATFTDPQIRIAFNNGLEIYVNHSTIPWIVTVGGTTYTIPEDGFVARQNGTGFLCFSAIPPTTGGQRIDYCYAPNRYEFFDGRGVVNGYAGIDTGGLKRVRVRNFVHGTTVWELSNGDIQTSQGVVPTVVRIDVVPSVLTLSPTSRLGLKAMATYSNGAVQNVTTLVTWSSSNSTIARMNRGAAVTAVAPGTTTLNITPYGGGQVFPATITVQ
jgi:hypothetical protein